MVTLSQTFLEELFHCSLCHEIMHAPSSLSCGHSFCCKCLQQALRHRSECPMCRAPCYTVTDPKPNVALSAILREAFPGRYIALGATGETASPALAQLPEVATRILPLFLSSSVQLPEINCSMHLYEPRYRLLTHRALDSGGDFVMVWARDAVGFPMIVDPASLVGVAACIVHIEQSRQLADGRWNLLCKGTAPAEIEECWVEDGTGNLFMARLRPRVNDVNELESEEREPTAMTDESGQVLVNDGGVISPGPDATFSQRIEYIRTQMHLLGVASRALHRTDPTRFSWEAAHAAGSLLHITGNDTMQIFLELSSTSERLTRLCEEYHDAFQRRWSVPVWISKGVYRWAPLVTGVLVLVLAARRT